MVAGFRANQEMFFSHGRRKSKIRTVGFTVYLCVSNEHR